MVVAGRWCPGAVDLARWRAGGGGAGRAPGDALPLRRLRDAVARTRRRLPDAARSARTSGSSCRPAASPGPRWRSSGSGTPTRGGRSRRTSSRCRPSRLRHRPAGAAGPHAGGQSAVGLRGAARHGDGGAGAGAGRAGRHRHLPPALLHDDGRVGPRLRRPGLAARGRPGARHAVRPVAPLLGRRNAAGAAGRGAAPPRGPLRRRGGGALVARRGRVAGGRRHAGAAGPQAPRFHAELSLPDPAAAGGGAAHGSALRRAGVRRDPRRLRGPGHHGGRQGRLARSAERHCAWAGAMQAP
jgi:hypothetical protein